LLRKFKLGRLRPQDGQRRHGSCRWTPQSGRFKSLPPSDREPPARFFAITFSAISQMYAAIDHDRTILSHEHEAW
jgi:hypothetical protein